MCGRKLCVKFTAKREPKKCWRFRRRSIQFVRACVLGGFHCVLLPGRSACNLATWQTPIGAGKQVTADLNRDDSELHFFRCWLAAKGAVPPFRIIGIASRALRRPTQALTSYRPELKSVSMRRCCAGPSLADERISEGEASDAMMICPNPIQLINQKCPTPPPPRQTWQQSPRRCGRRGRARRKGRKSCPCCTSAWISSTAEVRPCPFHSASSSSHRGARRRR